MNKHLSIKSIGKRAMFWRVLLALPALIAVGLIVPGAGVIAPAHGFQSAGDVELLGVRFGPDGAKTRIVLDLAGAPVFDISGDATGQGRLIIDITNMAGDRSGRKSAPGKGHIASYAYTPDGAGAMRFILDFGRTARIDDLFVLEPSGAVTKHRLVIDLKTAPMKDFLASLPRLADPAPAPDQVVVQKTSPPQTAPTKVVPAKRAHAPTPRAPRLKPISRFDVAVGDPAGPLASGPPPRSVAQILQDEEARKAGIRDRIAVVRRNQRARASGKSPAIAPTGKITVVIDPGHGGAHPGAVGQKGTLEKDVNLAAAKSLAEQLAKTGHYKVILTRTDDRKIALERRAQIASDAGANLFISLHADGNDNRTLRGSSVYTLSDAGTARSMEAFDADIAEFSSELGSIMFDVVQKKTRSESQKFANLLLPRLNKVTVLVKNAKRSEDLKVLLRPDVPAVLLEMAFISNSADEKNLSSEAWRKKTMGAVVAAIDDYFKSTGVILQAANNTPPDHPAGKASGGGLN